MEMTTIEISKGLRNKLTSKKNIYELKRLEFVIQKMYNMMNKLKLWEELK